MFGAFFYFIPNEQFGFFMFSILFVDIFFPPLYRNHHSMPFSRQNSNRAVPQSDFNIRNKNCSIIAIHESVLLLFEIYFFIIPVTAAVPTLLSDCTLLLWLFCLVLETEEENNLVFVDLLCRLVNRNEHKNYF